MVEVITADEMRRLEKLAYEEGFSEAEFMETAGALIAKATAQFISNNRLEKIVTLLIGKGNNGGDALVAGRHLLENGFGVVAIPIYPIEEGSPLCQAAAQKFKQNGGKFSQEHVFLGVILDGLVGTGFKGKAEGLLAQMIEKANGSSLPILAIDIPSGLNGNTGEVESVAIQATQTLFLGNPKLGFFLKEGWNHVGELIPIDFGLPQKFLSQVRSQAILPSDETCNALLPSLKRTRHKYEAGYVIAFAGSCGMSGAAILSSYAALRSGAGIVRLFYSEDMESELSAAPWEMIKEKRENDLANLFQEMERAGSLLVGPGLGKHPSIKKQLSTLFSKLSIPCVIDADALHFLSERPHWSLPPHCVLTPHHGEMEKLLGKKPTWELCQQFVEEKKITLILKGAPTVIFHPSSLPRIMTHGDPGMATAGSGDVLTGIVASLIAQKLSPLDAATLAVYLHGCSGEAAAQQKTSYSLIASDIIEFLPKVFYKN